MDLISFLTLYAVYLVWLIRVIAITGSILLAIVVAPLVIWATALIGSWLFHRGVVPHNGVTYGR